MTDELLEQLAELEHEQWCHWTKHFIANNTDGNIGRWLVQMNTKYKDLSEEDKQKDRVWALKVIKVITKYNYEKAFGNKRVVKK